ncbi:ribonuclease P protein component [Halopseudomonas sabulinigri]|uniref:Ribonuclease P protein component n=1 Tax=Halopseudomonas sabulinigri TaxID=472181 RepID=A0A1H1U1A9_9GAMM|nr:ribonuclease P protein component [Halopseudomonas sabulinigri]
MLARENDLAHARLGLVIAKKNVRRAVDRNKVKRIARESFRQHRAELGNLDIVVLARKGVGDLDNTALHDLYQGMWRRLIKTATKNRSRTSGPPSSHA